MDMLMRDMTLNISSGQMLDGGSIEGKRKQPAGQQEEFPQLMKKEESRFFSAENAGMLQTGGLFFTAIPQAQAFERTVQGVAAAAAGRTTGAEGERAGISAMNMPSLKEKPSEKGTPIGAGQTAGGTEAHKRLPETGRTEKTEMLEAAWLWKGQPQIDKQTETPAFQTSFRQTEIQKPDGKTKIREEDSPQAKEAVGLPEIKDAGEKAPVREKKILAWKPAEQSDSIQKLADLVQKAMTSRGKELEIQLEPAQLGKIVIKAVYEAGKASVLITCGSEKTMEILSGHAREIGGILQGRTGEPTVVVIDRQQEDYTKQDGGQNSSGKEEQKNHKERSNKKITGLEGDFLEQLRLGII
ncbi:flagellar hook-length control protein FliK [Mediterraneibacter sp. NSJ-55]|uniref:Flagellar hook-length control protein FliK n=1 Tax=Mediterraneibacter hominis TaxID=2763054 RepID=A0A923LIC6_9FIRM|nr:flagellar hook-length control protein FliK [Mediterraneibacter hominis]MBC5689338.1 flagellar hook-length control protein FliK [Mediterraneibacter hominis]